MASKTFNVGIVGYGMAAKVFHIPLVKYVQGLKLHSVLQRTPKPDDDFAKDYPELKCCRTLEDLLSDKDLNVVVVTSTPDTHFDIAKAALEKGKHVVVEKPFCPTYKECMELVRLAEKVGKLLTVYQNRRWDSDFLTLQKIVNEGKLGRVVEFETHFDRFRPDAPPQTWKAKALPGGGAIYDLGAHLIDQVVQLYGMPKSVSGFVGCQRQSGFNMEGFDDSATVLLHYEGGMLATVKAAVISPETEQLRYWVRGDKGSFKKFFLDCQEDQLKAGQTPDAKEFGVEDESHHGALTTVTSEGSFQRETYPTVEPKTYADFYSKLLKALRGEDSVPVKPEDSAMTIKIIEMANQSTKEGRTLEVSKQ